MNVYLSRYPNLLWLLAWLMRFTGALLLSKVIRFYRVRWSITSLRLERIIPCEIPYFFVSYRSCDHFFLSNRNLFLRNCYYSHFSYKLHHLKILSVQNSVLTTQFHLGTFCQINIHYKCFKILSLSCVRTNTTGCERGSPCFSLLETSQLKVANFLFFLMFS